MVYLISGSILDNVFSGECIANLFKDIVDLYEFTLNTPGISFTPLSIFAVVVSLFGIILRNRVNCSMTRSKFYLYCLKLNVVTLRVAFLVRGIIKPNEEGGFNRSRSCIGQI